MRIMTYNIQHGRDHHTPDRDNILLSQIADVIRELDPVFCTLNEVRNEGKLPDYTNQAKAIGDALGWHHYFAEAIRFDGDNPYGNAIVSKYPIVEAETILIPDPAVKKYDGYYETRCVLKAVLDMEGKPFTVFTAHFGLNPDEAENAVNTVLTEVRKCNTPFCLQGDFNLQPDSPLLRPIFEELVDTACAGFGPMFTFSSDDPFEKIDYIFVSKDVNVLSADAPVVIASDHTPFIADIDF